MEVCLALWTASAPEREPLGWIARRIQEQMSTGPRGTLGILNEKLPGWQLDVLNAFYRLGVDDLDDAIEALAAEAPRTVARDLLLSGCEGVRPEGGEGDDPLSAIAASDALRPAAARRLRLAIVRPEETVLQMLDVLHGFVAAGYGRLWMRHDQRLTSLAAALSRELAADPMRAISVLSPRAVLDRGLDRLTFVGGQQGGVLRCDELDRVDLVPSLWLRRRFVMAKAPGRAALAVGRGPALRVEIEHDRMPAMLAALGDERRFAILRLCLRRPHTTSELAPVLGITEGPVSRHLKELERGGLVTPQRSGRHVRYSTAVEVLHLLGQGLQGLTRDAVEEPTLRSVT